MMARDARRQIRDLKDPELGQVLVLDPDLGFSDVIGALDRLGLVRDAGEGDLQPLPGGAPAAAGFCVPGHSAPRAIYSCNPVAGLQVLDVALVPPGLRARIAAALPIVPRAEVAAWVAGRDERAALRGFWAAVETERVDLLAAVSARTDDPRALVAQEAALARDRLTAIDTARLSVMGGMGMVAEIGVTMTETLSHPDQRQALLAGPRDMADLLVPDLAGPAARLCGEMLDAFPDATFLPATDPEQVAAAPAGLLRSHSRMSLRFPMGYRQAAPWLRPEVIWLCWRAEDARHGRMSFDGLAFTGDRWLFCPRPYRLVMRALPDDVRRLIQPDG